MRMLVDLPLGEQFGVGNSETTKCSCLSLPQFLVVPFDQDHILVLDPVSSDVEPWTLAFFQPTWVSFWDLVHGFGLNPAVTLTGCSISDGVTSRPQLPRPRRGAPRSNSPLMGF